MNLDAESSDVLLLELACDVALDEGSLTVNHQQLRDCIFAAFVTKII